MSARDKQAKQLARKLYQLSIVDGVVSAEKVSGVLEYVDKHRPVNSVQVLRAYQRLISAELAKSRALVEHAGSLENGVLKAIASSMTQHYKRTITAVAKSNPALIAGLRVHVGDDVYEASVASRLQALAASSL